MVRTPSVSHTVECDKAGAPALRLLCHIQTSSMAGEHTLSRELLSHGVHLSSPISAFWTFVGDLLPAPEDVKCCKRVGDDLATTHLAVMVGCMLELTYDDVLSSVVKLGGKRTWMRSIERLLNHTFKRDLTGAPPSAALYSAAPSVNTAALYSAASSVKLHVAHNRVEKLGDKLHRMGLLEAFRLDKDALYAILQDAHFPDKEVISKNDTKAVTDYIYNLVKTQFNDTGCSQTLFTHIHKQLKQLLPFPNNPKVRWAKKLEYRFEAGNRTNANVRPLPSLLPSSSPVHHGAHL